MSKTSTKPLTPAQVKRLNDKTPELVGATEVARMIGVEANNLGKVARVPAPVQDDLSRGRIWRKDVIEDFVRTRNAELKSNGQRRKTT